MSSPALSRTRIALGIVMAAATLATTGIAGTLALARNQNTNDSAEEAAHSTPTATTQPTRHKKASAPQSFTPASKPTATTAPSHTKTKGS